MRELRGVTVNDVVQMKMLALGIIACCVLALLILSLLPENE